MATSAAAACRLVVFLAAGLALVPPTEADGVRVRGTPQQGAIDCGSVPLPPARFDRPLPNRVIVMHVPFGLIDNACRARGVLAPTAFMGSNRTLALLDQVSGNGFEIQACSWTSGEDRFVLLPSVGTGGITEDFDQCALRHEIGHLNGWPSTHPDAHFGFLDNLDAVIEPQRLLTDVRLPAVKLADFPRTREGALFRRKNLHATHRVIVTVTEAFLGAR